MEPTKIVVLGAGYGGLLCAIRAQRQVGARGQVTLVSARPEFEERIRLHEAAVGRPPRVLPIAELLEGTGVAFRCERVLRIDPARRVLTTPGGTLDYHLLVYAPGSFIDLDALPGVRAHALALDGSTLARLRDRLPELAARGGRVVVCGGGLTGIEGATELAEAFPGLQVTLLTAGALADGYSPRGARHLLRAFERLGVALVERRRVRELRAGVIDTDEGPVRFDLCLWAGGFGVPALALKAGLPVDERGRLIVDGALRSVGDPAIFGAGDAVRIDGHHGSPLHMSCKTAMPAGAHAADNLSARVLEQPERVFRFRDTGVCISLGRGDALIQTRHPDGSPWFAITGRLGAFLKEQVCRYTVRSLVRERRGKRYRWLQGRPPRALPAGEQKRLHA